jgi:hypothetical protein
MGIQSIRYELNGKHLLNKSSDTTKQTPNIFQTFFSKTKCSYYVTRDSKGI